MVCAHFAERKLRKAGNRCQRVVQVVRDPARQPANRLHLLRLAQLVFEQAPVGDVLHGADHADGRAAGVALHVGAFVHPADRAVAAHDAVLDVVRRGAGLRRLGGLAHGVAIVLVHKLEKVRRCSGKFVGRNAEDPVRFRGPFEHVRSIELRDPAADVRDLLRLLEKGDRFLRR